MKRLSKLSEASLNTMRATRSDKAALIAAQLVGATPVSVVEKFVALKRDIEREIAAIDAELASREGIGA